ncbi:hypothetical protein CK203_084959 [Vitis vinifera]|uniref:Uncharacterized protein n=1 Tax=Vitis vinifera TaxID=29760 RepID=A0A438CXI6_VITVI|nr:hypothetical protein CK203_084959 [Vitis vinifera]
MEASFAAQKKELEEEYQQQADEMYFFSTTAAFPIGLEFSCSGFSSVFKNLSEDQRSAFEAPGPCLTVVVRIVGSPIFVGMTASIPYARAKGVFHVGRPGVFDKSTRRRFRIEIPESDAIKLRTVISYNSLRDSKAADDVLPYELGDIFVLDAGAPEIGPVKDRLYKCPPIRVKRVACTRVLCACLGSSGRVPVRKIPYYVFRPLLAVCLVCLNGIASGGFRDERVGLHMYRQ